MLKSVIFILLSFSWFQITAQSTFEGSIIYKVQPRNPKPEVYPDSIFYTRMKQVN